MDDDINIIMNDDYDFTNGEAPAPRPFLTGGRRGTLLHHVEHSQRSSAKTHPYVLSVPTFCGGKYIVSWPQDSLTKARAEMFRRTVREYGSQALLVMINTFQNKCHGDLIRSAGFKEINKYTNPNSRNTVYVYLKPGGKLAKQTPWPVVEKE